MHKGKKKKDIAMGLYSSLMVACNTKIRTTHRRIAGPIYYGSR